MKKIDWESAYRSGKDYRKVSSELFQKILDQAPRKAGAAALDIGCGTGDLAIRLAQAGYQVMGIDVSGFAIEQAKANSREAKLDNTEFIVSNFDSFNPSAKFDLVVCKLVLAFIEDKPQFLSRIKSLLKPGGLFIVNTPVISSADRDYSPRICNISMVRSEVDELLQHNFPQVGIIDEFPIEESATVITYVCKTKVT